MTDRLPILLLSWVLALPSTLGPTRAPAAEIDSVTTQGIALDDSLGVINAIFSERLREGVAQANARQRDFANMDADAFCDPDRLYAELKRAIFDSFLPRWGLRGYDLDHQMREALAERSYSLALEDSIYRDIDYLEGFSLRLKELSDVVDIDGHLVGLDKIGHFFAEGWTYFDRTRDEGESLAQAMQWGSRQEAGKLGYATTGIYSFADLTANFNGWRFWNAILQTEEDPLRGPTPGLLRGPYVQCEFQFFDSLRYGKRIWAWRVRKSFDLADYVDGAWDERNNCNSYADPTIEAKVVARTQEVAPGFRCPRQPAECQRARERYGRFAKLLLHPLCLTAPEP
ncbi:hypothetical protein [Thiococcus pfennigii]|uniref:hypothetical protein n=1 Tax=Thiococcus pfennigii TaxID=1057 RepID=UPI001906D002|nr:hypothetical protein [Thiococcus pfennigii]